ncbi:MAG: hypothetical protein QOJ97_2759 [Solirubrobacteraceae bacterium]|jgi:hypothetical protein|nr:hypothetical protein [Solirubrobacteraceae bacterium]
MGLFDKMKDAQQQAQDAMSSAGAAQAPPGMPGMGGVDMAAQAAYAQKAQKLQAAGVEAPGQVLAIRGTGTTDMGGGQETDFDVTISPAGGQAYQTTVRQSMLPAQLEGIAVGAAITVKYDPDDPSQALIYGW